MNRMCPAGRSLLNAMSERRGFALGSVNSSLVMLASLSELNASRWINKMSFKSAFVVSRICMDTIFCSSDIYLFLSWLEGQRYVKEKLQVLGPGQNSSFEETLQDSFFRVSRKSRCIAPFALRCIQCMS